MKNFLEPNKNNIEKSDYVVVRLAHPETATIDEIVTDFTHAGEVTNVYHTAQGILRIEVAGLESKLGRNWIWQDRILSVDKARNSIFEADEPKIEVSIFHFLQANQRETVQEFRGDVSDISAGEYEVYSADSGNSYVVKIQETERHYFNVGCTCKDFTNRKRVCKHINHVFNRRPKHAIRLVA